MKWMDKFILDENKNVVKATLTEWAVFFEDFNKRLVKKTTIGDVSVSTVFIGMHLGDMYSETPMVFETLITGGTQDEEIFRYSTWDEAEKHHNELIERITISPFSEVA